MRRISDDKTRLLLAITALLWVSAFAALLIGFKLRLRPILLLGGLNALLAFFASTLVAAGRRRG